MCEDDKDAGNAEYNLLAAFGPVVPLSLLYSDQEHASHASLGVQGVPQDSPPPFQQTIDCDVELHLVVAQASFFSC